MDDRRDDYDDIEAILRDLDATDLEQLPAPPTSVWDAIQTEIGRDDASSDDTSDDDTVIELDARRRGVRWALASVAAALLAVAISTAVVLTRTDDADVLATATLEFDAEAFDPLGADASMTVDLLDEGDHQSIAVDQSDLPTELGEDADLELWLIQTDDAGEIVDIVPLGLVDPADPGSYTVPAGIDPTRNTLVDISVEPRDGDDTHSGRSILRGPLTSA